MSSEAEKAYVWVWLPGAEDPVVAGVLEPAGPIFEYTYARSYLDREEAFPLYRPSPPPSTSARSRARGARPPRRWRSAPPGARGSAGVTEDEGGLGEGRPPSRSWLGGAGALGGAVPDPKAYPAPKISSTKKRAAGSSRSP